MTNKNYSEDFEIYLVPPQGNVKLSHLYKIGGQVQKTLNAVARNLSSNENAYVDAEIVEARIGSLELSLHPSVPDIYAITSQRVCFTLVKDLLAVPRQQFRADMTPALVQQYHALTKCLKDAHIKIRLRYHDAEALIDDAFRAGVEVAVQEKEAGTVEVIGRIEAINIHQERNRFFLYPKQPGSERVECRFDSLLHSEVSEALKRKEFVKITGIGYYAPVGIYPQRIELTRSPEPIVYRLDVLKKAIRSLDLVPSGMGAVEYVAMKRMEAGLGE